MKPTTKLCAALLLIALGAPAPIAAQALLQSVQQPQPLQQRVEARLAEAGPGVRFGLVIAAKDGRELVAIAPDQRFIPASNTKIFTTAAAFATLPGLDQPDAAGGAAVRLERLSGDGRGIPDVILVGNGDARLSSAPDCLVNCLTTLADAVAAKTRVVRDVIGDDTLFPDQRWSPGMSWNNIPTRSGTATSALSLDDNELAVRITPTVAGTQPRLDALPYYDIKNDVVTVADGATELAFDRLPGHRIVRVSGVIALGVEPVTLRLGIDEPAHYAAWRLKTLLEARGVRVAGTVDVRNRLLGAVDDPKLRTGAPMRFFQPEALARLVPPPLSEDLVVTNKVSQNLHAELLLRRVGLVNGTGSIADGQAAVQSMLARAGVPRAAYDSPDGSGMSTYNRAAPRSVVTLLRWIAAQPWGAAWRATLPIAGVDGTLATRFRGTPVEGRLFAKTGTLNATHALSGYLIAKSGRTLTFSSYANDVPEGINATAAVDVVLQLVAEEN